MNKLLRPMIIVLLLLSMASLTLGILLFNEREVIKARTQRLEEGVADVAASLRYEELDPERLMEFDQMESELNRVDVHAALTWQDLQDTQHDLEVTEAELEETREELRITQNDLEASRAEVARLEENLAETRSELASANRQVNQLEREKASLEGRIDDLEMQVAELEDDKFELTQTIEAKRELIDEYEAELFPDDDTVDTPKGLTGKIAVVRPDWNFVVLDVGREEGLRHNTQLLVHRDEELVGRVRVSSLEDNMAVAEIMRDETQIPLERGDDVLF